MAYSKVTKKVWVLYGCKNCRPVEPRIFDDWRSAFVALDDDFKNYVLEYYQDKMSDEDMKDILGWAIRNRYIGFTDDHYGWYSRVEADHLNRYTELRVIEKEV